MNFLDCSCSGAIILSTCPNYRWFEVLDNWCGRRSCYTNVLDFGLYMLAMEEWRTSCWRKSSCSNWRWRCHRCRLGRRKRGMRLRKLNNWTIYLSKSTKYLRVNKFCCKLIFIVRCFQSIDFAFYAHKLFQNGVYILYY